MQTVYLQMAIPVYTMRSLRSGVQIGYYDRKNKAKCGTRPCLQRYLLVVLTGQQHVFMHVFMLLTESANPQIKTDFKICMKLII